MKYLLGIALAACLLVVKPVHAEESESVANARVAATSWLALIDAGEYGKSWGQAASLFQSAISTSDWQSAAEGVRAPLGRLESRTLKSAEFTRSLPGVPEGEYVVIQYESEFERKASAIETVTPLREKDGTWKVSGYYIK